MKDWIRVRGSQIEKPLEFDTISSPTTVYQHRNIIRVTETNSFDDSTIELWEYDERELTHEEYLEVYTEVLQSKITEMESNVANLEDYICMMDSQRG